MSKKTAFIAGQGLLRKMGNEMVFNSINAMHMANSFLMGIGLTMKFYGKNSAKANRLTAS
jgi:hypothetical protein